MSSFYDLPEITGTNVRFVGSTLMDEEQFREEGWHEYNGTWRASLQGLQRFGRLKAERKEERRSSWKARRDAEDEYSDSITALIEAKEASNG